MATIELRGYLPSGDKIYGRLYDRFIIGRNAVKLNFSVLPITDPKKDFCYYDCVVDETLFDTAQGSTVTFNTSHLSDLPRSKAKEQFNMPFFYSTCSPGHRRQKGATQSYSFVPVGYFKGPEPYITIDNTGTETDFLPPGMMLLPSGGGVVHEIKPNDEIDYKKNSSFSRQQPFILTTDPYIQNLPMCIGHNEICFAFSQSPYDFMINCLKAASSIPPYFSTRGDLLTFSRFIGQDANYIYYLQDWANGNYAIASGLKVSATGFLQNAEIVSIKKSDGNITDLLLPVTYHPTTSAGYFGLNYCNIQEVMTTDATPLKAVVIISCNKLSARHFSFNKIVNNSVTNIANMIRPTTPDDTLINHSFFGTRLMNHLQASYSDSWKAYYPTIGYSNNHCSFLMARLSKKLTGTPTISNCTITGLPAEYASDLAGYMKPLFNQGTNAGNMVWAAEIYDESDQYVAYWFGTVKAKAFVSIPWDTNFFAKIATDAYRYFLVFKVDPTDDTKLIYQSCIPEFKMMNPIYVSVASDDNKHIAVANEDGVKIYIWSTVSKSFVVAEDIAIPGVWSLSMEKYNGTGKGTVWVEAVKDLTKQHCDDAYLMQIDFGDFIDVDLRYWNGTIFKEDFTSSMLTVTKDVNGNFETHTIDIQVRVKSKTGEVETAFVGNETVRLKINGAKESDEIFFVGHDLNAPHQKTITTTTDWTTITVSYKYPFANTSITAERLI